MELKKDQEYKYFVKPENESCYDYMLGCYGRISADVGEYPAFQIFGCDTSMQDFIAEVEALAGALYARGFRAGDVVSVFLPTCAHSMVAFYALSKLGAVVEFVHPLTPPEGLKKSMESVGSKAVFLLDRAADAYADAVGEKTAIVCSFSDHVSGPALQAVQAQEAGLQFPAGENYLRYADLRNAGAPAAPAAEKSSRETAVYMHGSGTTGASKTVCLSAYAINSVAYSQYFIDKYHDYGKSYSICVLPFFHAFGLGASMHYCLCNAYTPILVPKFDAHTVNALIAKNNVQYISGVPNMFYKMYEADNFDNPGLKNLTVLYSGGDIVSEGFIEKFTAVLKKNGSIATLFRGWGLTEMCAICSTNSHDNHRAGSIGKIGKGMEVKVIGEEGETLPANAQGEICLSGETMMNGYLQEEGVTETGIRYDAAGKPWVHTGDMGYVDEDGFIFFTGRKKRIIVISGYNVYPYSIEQEISRLPYVREACAVQGYLNDKPCVKLCVVPADEHTPHETIERELLTYCEKHLDHFSVPRKIEFLSALPRTKMDKMDFLAMSDPVPGM